jgi:hypothetical protein
VQGAAGIVGQTHHRHQARAAAAFAALVVQLGLRAAALVHQGLQPVHGPRLSRIVDQFAPAPPQQDTSRAAAQAFAAGIGRQHLEFRIGDEDRVGAGLEHLGRQLQLGFVGQLLRDVAEGIDPPDGPPAAVLRPRDPLDDTPPFQGQEIGGFEQGRAGDDGQLVVIGRNVQHRFAQPGENGLIVAPQHERLGKLPQVGQALVVAPDGPVQIHGEDAVGRGFQRGAQFGHQALEFVFGAPLLRAVAQAHQEDRVSRRQPQQAHAALDLDQAAIGTADQRVRQDAVAQAGGHILPEHHVFGRGCQLDGRAAHQGAVACPQQGMGRLVRGHHPQVHRVDHPHGLEHAVDEVLERRRQAGLTHARGSSPASAASTARSKK